MTSANGQQFWCSVPAAPAVNASSTASFRGTADLEARKQLRAKGISRGVALIESLRGTCLYLRQGWFTYSFCYDQEVRQFHEVQRIGATRPVEDPNSDAYVLGQAPSLSPPPELQHPRHDSGNPTAAAAAAALARSAPETDEGETTTHTIQVFLGGGDLLGQGRENGMYLAQKWDGGTLCDKTGAPRQVEIQYHCNTETTDRIALVREVAICQYVMLIHTPRLCTEPLFLEGRTDEQDPENVIECRPVVDEATARMLLPAEPPLDTADAEQAAPETSIVLTGDAVEEAAPIISDNDALQGSSSDEPTELGEGEFETELVATIVYDPTTGEIVSTDTSATVLNNGNDAGHETEASNALQEEAANKALEEFIQKVPCRHPTQIADCALTLFLHRCASP